MLRSGVGRTALDGQIKAGTFPAPAKVGSSSRWFRSGVAERTIANLMRFGANGGELGNGGRGEIRTHGWLAPSPVFKTGALNHSATLP